MIFRPQPRLRDPLELGLDSRFSTSVGEKPTPSSRTRISSVSGSSSPSSREGDVDLAVGRRLCSKALMQASTTASRTSSTRSGLMPHELGEADRRLLATTSMSGTIGRVSVTSRRTGYHRHGVIARRRAGGSEAQIELERGRRPAGGSGPAASSQAKLGQDGRTGDPFDRKSPDIGQLLSGRMSSMAISPHGAPTPKASPLPARRDVDPAVE